MEEPALPSGASVLLVDDDRTVLNLLDRVLRGRCEVVRAESLEEGLAAIEARRFDLILTDQHFPEGGSALALARRAREKDPRSKVLLMSALPTPPSEAERQQLGVVDCLSKPFSDLKALRSLIEGLLVRP